MALDFGGRAVLLYSGGELDCFGVGRGHLEGFEGEAAARDVVLRGVGCGCIRAYARACVRLVSQWGCLHFAAKRERCFLEETKEGEFFWQRMFANVRQQDGSLSSFRASVKEPSLARVSRASFPLKKKTPTSSSSSSSSSSLEPKSGGCWTCASRFKT